MLASLIRDLSPHFGVAAFVPQAAQRKLPIAAVDLGRTRADDLLTLKVEDRCETALAFLL